MLKITIPGGEYYDDTKGVFIYNPDSELLLEHSLVSVAKWESKWCKSFIGTKDKTIEEVIDYIQCMCKHDIDPSSLEYLTNNNVAQIMNYINAPMTATRFTEDPNAKPNREVVTAELIYFWMISHNIPMECQDWHLNRLLTLIRVCNIKNSPPKKMSRQEIMSRNAVLNAARRKQLNTKG